MVATLARPADIAAPSAMQLDAVLTRGCLACRAKCIATRVAVRAAATFTAVASTDPAYGKATPAPTP